MMKHRRFAVAVTVVATLTLAVGPAIGTPPSGFSRSPQSVGSFGQLDIKAVKDNHWDLFLKTKAPTDIAVDRLTVQPGGYSGWHHHAGPVLLTVVAGEITWYDRTACSWQTVRAGESFVEGAQRAHNVRNNGTIAAEFVAIQMLPTGSPFRIEDPEPTHCS